MNETLVTITGNVVSDVSEVTTASGIEIRNFRIATTTRRFDRGLSQWVDGDTSYMRVSCWRQLGRNVAESIVKGDPVIVTGTMRVKEWSNEAHPRSTVEIEAISVGHDLRRGVSAFARAAKRASHPENSPEAPDAKAAA